jgi:hypothetical protein
MVAAAVCPHPPLLVPQLAAGAAAELDAVRAACAQALATLADSGARRLVVVGTGPAARAFDPPFVGSFAPWGEALTVRLGDGPADGTLPLSLTVATWLLDRYFHAPASVDIAMRAVPADLDPASCREAGERLGGSTPWGLLVMGDGSACRGEKSPGYADVRAEPFDNAVAAALAGGDPDALAALDPAEAGELLAVGRAPWQVLAGAAAGRSWRGSLLAHEAPYGVAYLVATWLPQ